MAEKEEFKRKKKDINLFNYLRERVSKTVKVVHVLDNIETSILNAKKKETNAARNKQMKERERENEHNINKSERERDL